MTGPIIVTSSVCCRRLWGSTCIALSLFCSWWGWKVLKALQKSKISPDISARHSQVEGSSTCWESKWGHHPHLCACSGNGSELFKDQPLKGPSDAWSETNWSEILAGAGEPWKCSQCSPELGYLHQTREGQLHKRVTSVEDKIQLIFFSTQVWIDVMGADVDTILIRREWKTGANCLVTFDSVSAKWALRGILGSSESFAVISLCVCFQIKAVEFLFSTFFWFFVFLFFYGQEKKMA